MNPVRSFAIFASTLLLAAPTALAQTEIVYWYGQGGRPGEAHEELVARFNEAHPDIQVTPQFQGSYFDTQQKLTAAVTSGTQPAVVNLEVTAVVPFARAGQLADLTQFIDESFDLADMPEGLLQDGYIGDGLYALPFARSTPVLYYNADMLEAAGLPARAPETWDEFQSWIRQIAEQAPDRYGFCHNQDTWSATYIVRSLGGTFSEDDYTWTFADDPATLDAVTRWASFFDEDAGGQYFPRGTESGAQVQFVNQRCAMIIQSTGSMAGINDLVGDAFEVGVGYIPAGETRFVPTGGNSISMLQGLDPEEQEAAWEFIAFMTSPESTAWLSQYTGYMPSRSSVANSPAMQEVYAQNPNFEIAVQQLEYAQPQARFMHVPQGSQIIDEAFERIILQDEPVDATLQNAAQQLTQAAQRTGFYE